MRIDEVLTAPHSPWQNPFAEGSSARCDASAWTMSSFSTSGISTHPERHLRRILTTYLGYYHRARRHLSLDKDAPDGRPIEPAGHSTIITILEGGDLHHRYVRRTA